MMISFVANAFHKYVEIRLEVEAENVRGIIHRMMTKEMRDAISLLASLASFSASSSFLSPVTSETS